MELVIKVQYTLLLCFAVLSYVAQAGIIESDNAKLAGGGLALFTFLGAFAATIIRIWMG